MKKAKTTKEHSFFRLFSPPEPPPVPAPPPVIRHTPIQAGPVVHSFPAFSDWGLRMHGIEPTGNKPQTVCVDTYKPYS